MTPNDLTSGCVFRHTVISIYDNDVFLNHIFGTNNFKNP